MDDMVMEKERQAKSRTLYDEQAMSCLVIPIPCLNCRLGPRQWRSCCC